VRDKERKRRKRRNDEELFKSVRAG